MVIKKPITTPETTNPAPVPEGAATEVNTAPKTKTKVEPVVDEGLVSAFVIYDEQVASAEKAFIELVEYIQEHQLDRATVIVSMMKARGISYESAQAKYGTLKKIFNNEEVLQELKDGKITLKVAREKTKSTQKNPASAKPEAKEARYTSTLKAFIASAKESGFSLREIMVGVEAELRSAGIK
jgi:hypothetical protein